MQIAALQGRRVETLGEATASVTQLKETAKNSLYQMKMDVFQGDSDAFLRYTLADSMNPKIIIRLFQSGPGTFWTNMDGKNLNMFVPAGTPTAADPPHKQLPTPPRK